MSITDKYIEIENKVKEAAVRSGRDPADVTLMAVTKTRTPDEINQAVSAGAHILGENKVQEIIAKYDEVSGAEWHMIGHLQTNKVKSVIDKVAMIHSVDSMHLAEEIDKRAGNAGIVMDILIEINSAMEESKSGIAPDDLFEFAGDITDNCANIRLRGIMCIPPAAEDPEDNRGYFREAKELFGELQDMHLPEDRAKVDTLSMGMSGDYEVAIEEGATIVRVGSSIFGPRNYR